jgi:hypothetical protein
LLLETIGANHLFGIVVRTSLVAAVGKVGVFGITGPFGLFVIPSQVIGDTSGKIRYLTKSGVTGFAPGRSPPKPRAVAFDGGTARAGVEQGPPKSGAQGGVGSGMTKAVRQRLGLRGSNFLLASTILRIGDIP